jgi:hypothetical protein
MTPLCELARKHQTDKGGGHLMYGGGDSDTCHNYTPHYDHMFKDMRDKPINLLEIGVNRGCSLKMWAEYFPNAHLVGIDCSAECLKGGSWCLLTNADTRIDTVAADQNNVADLHRALGSLGIGPGTFKIIIDDGSHVREHQRVSLTALLPYLKPGGLYVVEDLGTKFQDWELMQPVADIGWECTVIPVEGGLGKAACTEFLFVVERPQ